MEEIHGIELHFTYLCIVMMDKVGASASKCKAREFCDVTQYKQLEAADPLIFFQSEEHEIIQIV